MFPSPLHPYFLLYNRHPNLFISLLCLVSWQNKSSRQAQDMTAALNHRCPTSCAMNKTWQLTMGVPSKAEVVSFKHTQDATLTSQTRSIYYSHEHSPSCIRHKDCVSLWHKDLRHNPIIVYQSPNFCDRPLTITINLLLCNL